ncbi:MAG: hypothetical protein ABTQ26_00270 [Azonexus sp.]
MSAELHRVESAVSAISSGNLTWDKWPIDAITALGLSGFRNPLGFAMVRYLNDQTSTAVWGVVLALSTVLMKRNVDLTSGLANELAFKAFEFWNNMHCRRCTGRGITGIEQTTCPVCGGSGDRPITDANDNIKAAVGCLIEAQQWMEGQLAVRMRGERYLERAVDPRTSRASSHD